MNTASRSLAFLLGLVLALSGRAYDISEIDGDAAHGNAPILLGWELVRFPLVFNLDTVAPAAVADAASFQDAIRAAFRSWEDASQGRVGFRDEPVPGGVITPAALQTSIGNADCTSPADCVHFVATVTTNWAGLTGTAADVIALTLVKFDTTSRRILDADILFNNQFQVFDTTGAATRFDVEGIAAHEVGHALGIAHPGSPSRASSTMWAVTPPGNILLRSLEIDDTNAVRYLYAPLTEAVPPPDNNFLGLLERSGGGTTSTPGGGGTGCELAVEGEGSPLLVLLWAPVLLGLGLGRLLVRSA